MLRPWWPKGFSCVSHELVTANTAHECLNSGLPSFCLIQKVYFTDNIALTKKKNWLRSKLLTVSQISTVYLLQLVMQQTHANVDKNKIPTQTLREMLSSFLKSAFPPHLLTFTAEVRLPKSLDLQNN